MNFLVIMYCIYMFVWFVKVIVLIVLIPWQPWNRNRKHRTDLLDKLNPKIRIDLIKNVYIALDYHYTVNIRYESKNARQSKLWMH